MVKLTCVIIEDDIISMEVIEALAGKSNLLEVKQKFTTAQEAIPWLATNQVDLLFLDIELPEISGLEFLRAIHHRPHVIIVSANSKYAIDAFEFDVVDFLVKPIKEYTRFLSAINKVLTRNGEREVLSKEGDNLFVRVDAVLLKLIVDDIVWIEAFGDYIKIQTSEKLYTVYSTLKKIEEKISDNKFIRVHRSFIVNITKITNIDPCNLEINKRVIPVSATYKEALLKKISVL